MCERRVSGFWCCLAAVLDAGCCETAMLYLRERCFLNGLIKSQSPLKRNPATSNHSQSPRLTSSILCFDIPPPPPIHILFCITFFRMSLMCDFKSQTAFQKKYFKCYFSWHQHWYTIIFFVNVLNKNVIYSGFISIKCFSIFYIYICILFYLYIL